MAKRPKGIRSTFAALVGVVGRGGAEDAVPEVSEGDRGELRGPTG